MKRFSEKFNTEASKIKLTKAESAALRERIVAFMEYHPLPSSEKTAPGSPKIRPETTPFIIFKIPARLMASGFVAMGVMVLVVMPVLAEQAVPGDVLYPVKVSINEEVRSTLNRDPYQKVVWETTRIERRLAETRLLAEEGKLTPEAEADLSAAVEEHSAKAGEAIAELKTENAEEAALAEMTFAARLTVEDALLDTVVAEAEDGQTESVARIAASVNEKRDAALSREEGSPVSFEKLLVTLETEIAKLHKVRQNFSDDTNKKTVTDFDRRLTDIERRVGEAKMQNDTDPVGATAALRAIWKDAQKLDRYGSDLSVRNTVSLDELIPVVLTEAERKEALNQVLANIEINVERISGGLPLVTDESVAEKAEYGLMLIASLREELSLAISGSDLATAEQKALEITGLIDSILTLAEFPDLTALPVATSTATSTATGTIDTETATTSPESTPPSV